MQETAACNDTRGFMRADRTADEAVADAAGNAFAARMVAPLRTHSRRFWYHFHNAADLGQAASYHAAVLRAIVNGNAGDAERQTHRLMSLLEAQAAQAARA